MGTTAPLRFKTFSLVSPVCWNRHTFLLQLLYHVFLQDTRRHWSAKAHCPICSWSKVWAKLHLAPCRQALPDATESHMRVKVNCAPIFLTSANLAKASFRTLSCTGAMMGRYGAAPILIIRGAATRPTVVHTESSITFSLTSLMVSS